MLKKFLVLIFTMLISGHALAQERPDDFIKRITQDILDTAKKDKDIQAGSKQRVLRVVEEKIIPHVDFRRMTALAAGRYWREASADQKKQLVAEFRSLLIYTYSGAIAQIKDQQLEFKPLRADPSDTEVEVYSRVTQPRGESIELDYRLAKVGDSWKIYDVNVLGAWLVETYKSNFASEISKSGIDGLIKALRDKNQKLAAEPLKNEKT